MESSLKGKFFDFLKSQKMNIAETGKGLKVILNPKLNVLVEFEDRLGIVLEYLEKNDLRLMARLNSKSFEYFKPNFFKWKVRERAETPADVLIKISSCVNKFEISYFEEFMGDKREEMNSWHINVNLEVFMKMTGIWPGSCFRDFFLLIFEDEKPVPVVGEKLFRVQCYFQCKSLDYKLICEENVDFYLNPLEKYIKDMNEQICALRINTKLSHQSSFSSSSSINK